MEHAEKAREAQKARGTGRKSTWITQKKAREAQKARGTRKKSTWNSQKNRVEHAGTGKTAITQHNINSTGTPLLMAGKNEGLVLAVLTSAVLISDAVEV